MDDRSCTIVVFLSLSILYIFFSPLAACHPHSYLGFTRKQAKKTCINRNQIWCDVICSSCGGCCCCCCYCHHSTKGKKHLSIFSRNTTQHGDEGEKKQMLCDDQDEAKKKKKYAQTMHQKIVKRKRVKYHKKKHRGVVVFLSSFTDDSQNFFFLSSFHPLSFCCRFAAARCLRITATWNEKRIVCSRICSFFFVINFFKFKLL